MYLIKQELTGTQFCVDIIQMQMESFPSTAEEKKKVYKHKLAAEYAPHIFSSISRLWSSNYFITPGKKSWRISPSLPATIKLKELSTNWSPAWYLWNVADVSAHNVQGYKLEQKGAREVNKEASILASYPGCSVTEAQQGRKQWAPITYMSSLLPKLA